MLNVCEYKCISVDRMYSITFVLIGNKYQPILYFQSSKILNQALNSKLVKKIILT